MKLVVPTLISEMGGYLFFMQLFFASQNGHVINSLSVPAQRSFGTGTALIQVKSGRKFLRLC